MDYTGAEILQLKDEGKTWREISALSGLPYNAVRNRARRYQAKQKRGPVSTAPANFATDPPQQGERVTDAAEENTREIETNSTRITTLEQLIDFCKIDLDVWTIERHVINKWEVGRKAITKNLVFTEGAIDGGIQDTGGINVEPLYQIKAWLVRKQPEAIKPVISPVNITCTFPKLPQPPIRNLRAALIIPDLQTGFSRDIMTGKLTPFHDRRAMDVVLQIAAVVMPDITIVAGDVVDWSGWSDKFIRKPEFYFTTQPALIEAAWYLRRVRGLTGGRVAVIEGNHDLRPETQIIAHLLDAYGLKSADQLDAAPVMSIDNLLGLSRTGVDYIGGYPDGEVWINDSTRVIHGEKVRGQPGQTAAAVVRDANETIVYGHIHRRESATKTIPTREGYRTVTAFCPGCLCHVDGRVPGSKRSDQWQQGAALVWFDETTATIQQIEIYNGQAVYNGQVYQGRDYVDELRRDTGWQQF